MRPWFAVLLLVTLIGATGFFYYQGGLSCDIPLTYRVGTVDNRFGISRSEAIAAITDAEALWEDRIGTELFIPDPAGEITINFIFDERQAITEAEQSYRLTLDEQKNLTEETRNRYELVVRDYDALKRRYDSLLNQYEAQLAEYNAEVARWNEEGGAPPDEYQALQDKQGELAGEQSELNDIVEQLNVLAAEINEIGEQGNQAVDTYNQRVFDYNQNFTESREFTQGDYQSNVINIYQFGSDEELRLVLAHEFGHALNLGHVEDEKAIMYSQMGGQSLSTGLLPDDVAEFQQVCIEDKKFLNRIFQ